MNLWTILFLVAYSSFPIKSLEKNVCSEIQAKQYTFSVLKSKYVLYDSQNWFGFSKKSRVEWYTDSKVSLTT